MHFKHSFFIRTFFVFILLSVISSKEVFACTIEKGPTPLFTAYIKNTEKRVQEIRTFAAGKNICNGKNGSFTQENRFLDFVDRIGSASPVDLDILTDFQYNVILTTEGNSKNPVMTQGRLLENLEKNTIIAGLRSVANSCALDEVQPNGQTTQDELGNILMQNRSLESFYKNVAIGNPRIPDGLSPALSSLYAEIRDNYSPEMTSTCKGNGDLDTIEDVIKKIKERFNQRAAKNDRAQNDWEEAIKIFQGKGGDTKEFKDLQSRLLATELARQGLTKKAVDAILGNLSCFQRKTMNTSTVEEMAKARLECMSNFVTGSENLTNWVKPFIAQSTNSDQYLKRVLRKDIETTRAGPDLGTFWMNIQTIRNDDEKLNDKMVTDLVNIHAELTIMNEILKEKSVEMYKNCMKGQPDIPCPQPR